MMSTSFFVSRRQQIEGDGVNTGAWPISWFRIAKGWGTLSPEFWPDTKDGVIPDEPPNADDIAKRTRLIHYQRLRTEQQCQYSVVIGRVTAVALEINRAWSSVNAKDGKIAIDTEDPPRAVHSVGLPFIDFDESCFPFLNTWGPEWGDAGRGYLPFGYLTRYMVEGWSFPVMWPPTVPDRPGIHCRSVKGESNELGNSLLLEILDGDKDIMVGWAFAVAKRNAFDIEELFVRPDYRRRGLGVQLGKALLGLHERTSVPIQFWIPWGDHEERNAPGLLRWAQKLGLRLEPSGVRWAAYRAQVGQPVDVLPVLDWIPKKAASPLYLLDDAPTVAESPSEVTWTEELADRRAELVEKKYRSSLTELERDEFDQLQEQFGRYQDTIAPFPPQ